ncbi:MAG: ATP-binding protein [Peptoniphilaceae bacterium]|nr:ATP-binding protein [Peptoniphilaceae bacterium]
MKNKLTYKLKKSILFLLMVVLLITSIFLGLLGSKRSIDQKVDYMDKALQYLLEKEGSSNFYDDLDDFSRLNPNLRLTYIDTNGRVLYDSNEDYTKMDNHANRAEFKEAMSKGESSDIRDSDTLGSRLYYISKKGNNILRLSSKISVFKNSIIYHVLTVFLIGIIAIIVLHIFTGIFVDRIINPIKNISDNPYDISDEFIDGSYDEIQPYLIEIKRITKELENENMKLKNWNQKISEITENIKEGMLLIDENFNINLLNPSILKIFGKNKSVSSLNDLTDDRLLIIRIKEAFILDEEVNFDLNINGTDFRVYIDPIFNNDKKNLFIIFVDNTENKRGEELRREFTANVSHELKSPLTSINGYAELISSGLANEKDIKEFAKIINKEGLKLLDTIDDLLKLSKLDEGSESIKFTEVNIEEVFKSIFNKFLPKIIERNLLVTFDIDDIKIRTNESLFIDLCTNIFENAIKYNKDNGKIKVAAKIKDDGRPFISIKDTGIGIKEENIERIFERFYIVDKARTSSLKSTGLGLSIVKHIAQNLGYTIDVNSEYNEGTEFIINLNE